MRSHQGQAILICVVAELAGEALKKPCQSKISPVASGQLGYTLSTIVSAVMMLFLQVSGCQVLMD